MYAATSDVQKSALERISRSLGIMDLDNLSQDQVQRTLSNYLEAHAKASGGDDKNLLALGIAHLRLKSGEFACVPAYIDKNIGQDFILRDHAQQLKATTLQSLARVDFGNNNFAQALQRQSESIQLWWEIYRHIPESPWLDDVLREIALGEKMLGDIHFENSNFAAAITAYRKSLLRNFPDNEEHQKQTQLGLAKANESAGHLRAAADHYAYIANKWGTPKIRQIVDQFVDAHRNALEQLAVDIHPLMKDAPPQVYFSPPLVKKPHATKDHQTAYNHPAVKKFYHSLWNNNHLQILKDGRVVLEETPGLVETREVIAEINDVLLKYLRVQPWDEPVDRLTDFYPVKTLSDMGYRLWSNGLSGQAVHFYKKILDKHPLEIETCHKALFFLGRIWEDKGNYPRALIHYKKLIEKYNYGRYSIAAQFKVPWLARLLGNHQQAKVHFEALIDFYSSPSFRKLQASYSAPDSFLSAAHFWLAETEGALGNQEARTYRLQKLTEEFPFEFYAFLSRSLLGLDLKQHLISQITQDKSHRKLGLGEVEGGHLLRAEKLIAIGLLKRARTELNRLERIRGNPAFLFYMAQLFHRAGDFQRSIRLSWKIVEVKNLSTVPEDISQALFPKAHWDLVRQVADANELDPFFILSLMRQESAFQAEVISTSNAIGLMQLLPGTASLVARSMKQKAPEVDELKEPDTNIPLGTRYIANLLTRFGQNKAHALAAYNAGPRKVKNWLKIRSQLSPLEFIESIPYNETRNYVKKILRNYAIYHALYSDSPEDALKHLLTNPAP